MANVSSTLPSHPLFLQASGADPEITYPASEFRWLVDSIFGTSGVISVGDFLITQRGAGANFSIDIAAGQAIVSANAADEKYFARTGATVNISVSTLNTSPASLRTHAVYLAIYDKFVAGSTYDAQFFIGEDTGSGAPTPTGSAVGYLLLGTFTITTSQVSITNTNITNNTSYASRSSAWNSVAGTFAAGYTATTNLAWRRVGDIVEWRGSLTKTNAANGETTVVTGLPLAARPAQEGWMSIASAGAGIDDQARARFLVNGSIITNVAGPGSGVNALYFDGCRYQGA